MADLDVLARELRAAAAARDWDRLGAAARAVPARLEAMRGTAPDADQASALARLRAAHEQAEAALAGAARELGERLEQMNSNKEGWMAYALNAETPAE